MSGMLAGYRVLDLTDARADIAGMVFADLGADVIKVEPPGGVPGRKEGPVGPAGSSLRFAAYNRNKRSVTLDLDDEEGRRDFLRLVASADFLLENAAPGSRAREGLAFEDLRQVNPGLVYISVTPFGQDGPYAGHLATDLTLAAMGGLMAVTGDADRPPVRVSVPQTWHHASVEAVVGGLVAHFRRLQTGDAQHVDVSVQAAVVWTLLNASLAHAVQGANIERNGTLVQLGIVDVDVLFPAADGFSAMLPSGATMAALLPHLIAEGIVPESWLLDDDWPIWERSWYGLIDPTHGYREVVDALRQWTVRHKRAELMEIGLRKGVTIAPISRVSDVLALDHLRQRKYWQPLGVDGITLDAPGPFVRASGQPIGPIGGVPRAGEHTAEVLAEASRPVSTASVTPAASSGLPFEGLKVADFSWIGVGPITAKYLADHGATVVRVESETAPDRLRGGGPFKDKIPGLNRSQFFASFNSSKLSLALDLKSPAGLVVAKRLVEWADVSFESFTPGTLERLGLGYEEQRRLNPGIIMVSTCLMGHEGPAKDLAGYGYHGASIAGFYEVTGWPDRPPGGPYAAYTDTVAPRFLATTVMAALDYRRRTGEGQHLEQAQVESAIHFFATELLDYQVSGRQPVRSGNASPEAAPHGAYPCRGEDQWCAVAVETDQQWKALQRVVALPWVDREEFASLETRLANAEALDRLLAEWTAGQDAWELMQRLQSAGVPAGVVQRSSDLRLDPQLAHRHFFRPLEHAEMGEVPYEGHGFRVSGYDSGPRSAAPCLGEHTFQVLSDLLGMSAEEIGRAAEAGALR